MNTLILTVGLPRSGKSTWAREHMNVPIVSPDSIRLALYGQPFIASMESYVWAIAKTMVEALFLAGHPVVILDATNTTQERRDEWLSDEWKVEYQLFKTSKEECIRRAIESGTEYLVPVIERMALELEWPELDKTP